MLDITSSSTPRKYRLLDCELFAISSVLHVVEFSLPADDDLSTIGYAAISYVWRDPDIINMDSLQFSVKGAEDADPIAIDVLLQACLACRHRGIQYVWLDRLCIMQTSREDKRWQIMQMSHIYKSCALCIVLPGGLQRCVAIDEQTLWIHRAWTLQEVLLPREVVVLLAWGLGSGWGAAYTMAKADKIEEVNEGLAAIFPLRMVLNACSVGWLEFLSNKDSTPVLIEARVFGRSDHHLASVTPPHVSALALNWDYYLEGDEDAKQYAVWQCALVRTSSRPVDMVFSIMGLFDVTLDPAEFDVNDRIGATIALARNILAKGGRACWMGVSFWLEPCSRISTFAMFPETSVAGRAIVRTTDGQEQEVSELICSEFPSHTMKEFRLPCGSMDDDGYLTFRARAIRVTAADDSVDSTEDRRRPSRLYAQDGTTWSTVDAVVPVTISSSPSIFAVVLGWFTVYVPGATPAIDSKPIRLLLLEEHATGKYHVRSFCFLSVDCRHWVLTWKMAEFSVGGPISLSRKRSAIQLHDRHLIRESPAVRMRQLLPLFPTSSTTILQDVERSRKWAIPQRTVESYYRQNHDDGVRLVKVYLKVDDAEDVDSSYFSVHSEENLQVIADEGNDIRYIKEFGVVVADSGSFTDNDLAAILSVTSPSELFTQAFGAAIYDRTEYCTRAVVPAEYDPQMHEVRPERYPHGSGSLADSDQSSDSSEIDDHYHDLDRL
ncbi:unnamed protein product [Somion occarium]